MFAWSLSIDQSSRFKYAFPLCGNSRNGYQHMLYSLYIPDSRKQGLALDKITTPVLWNRSIHYSSAHRTIPHGCLLNIRFDISAIHTVHGLHKGKKHRRCTHIDERRGRCFRSTTIVKQYSTAIRYYPGSVSNVWNW